ncbi:hypothetical protein PUN28_004455 [Cardiocondyla obscurior]|uniref:Uncharacterized protein n=1 Tax=Cardiocondyla obscurior TaxID=286306 RepID=A0AAW2GCR1_9HYME
MGEEDDPVTSHPLVGLLSATAVALSVTSSPSRTSYFPSRSEIQPLCTPSGLYSHHRRHSPPRPPESSSPSPSPSSSSSSSPPPPPPPPPLHPEIRTVYIENAH